MADEVEQSTTVQAIIGARNLIEALAIDDMERATSIMAAHADMGQTVSLILAMALMTNCMIDQWTEEHHTTKPIVREALLRYALACSLTEEELAQVGEIS